MFYDRQMGCNLRENVNPKVRSVRITLKSICVTVRGVKLWDGSSTELKKISSVIVEEKKAKKKLFSSTNNLSINYFQFMDKLHVCYLEISFAMCWCKCCNMDMGQ